MTTLDLNSVELVSTLRAAPQNGPSNSQDYNDSWTEALADLASLSGFLNDILLPMLNGLSAAIQPVENGPILGLEGRFIFGDTTDTTSLFFDSLTSSSLPISDSLRLLNGIVTTTQVSVQTLSVEVTALQTALSTTNQNDISQALQNFAATLEALQAQVVANSLQIGANKILLLTGGVQNPLQNRLNMVAGLNVTLTPDNAGNVVIASSGSGGGGLVLEVDGVAAGDQSLLNFIPGTRVTIVDNGTGGITFDTVDGVDTVNGLHGAVTLVAGSNITLTPSGNNITIAATGGGSSITLKTNGTNNGSQSILNLAAGSNITLVDNGSGQVTITAAASAVTLQHNGTNNGSQSILNLKNGTGITVSDDGSGGITIATTVVAPLLKTGGVSNSTQTLLNIAAGTGITAVETSGTVTITATGGGGSPSRSTYPQTTGSLANNAVETGTMTIGKTFNALQVVVSDFARVRLYSTAAAATADVSRPFTTPPTVGTQHGVILDLNLDSTGGVKTFVLAPSVLGSNMETSPSTSISYNITNLKGSTSTITATITALVLES